MLDTLLAFLFSDPSWQTVSRELGRIDLKSLNDRRRIPSSSSGTLRECGGIFGKSFERRASSELLKRPKAREIPIRQGTAYLHKYSGKEKHM